MKTIIFLFVLSWAMIVNAATWTIHGCKDNYSFVFWNGGVAESWYFAGYVNFDYAWDQISPEIGSGVYWTDGYTEWANWGYADILTIEVDDRAEQIVAQIGGTAPEYLGIQDASSQFSISQPGEYWLDFGPSSVIRVLLMPPNDFGKWAWDGSINPSWVEPPLAPAKRGKGHKK